MTFNEQNTIEEYVISKLSSKWKYIPPDQLGRDERDVLIEGLLKKSLMRINPEIRLMPERADEVIYKLIIYYKFLLSNSSLETNVKSEFLLLAII